MGRSGLAGKAIGTAEEIVHWLFQQPNDGRIFQISEVRQKRSLTQNAYYWSLLNQLASKLRIPNSEVHFNMLREYGVFEVVSVMSSIDVSGYFKYYDVIGHGTVNDREFTHYRIYKGSSQMNSKEFSRLIDGMREECILQGIPVMTPEEIASLKHIGGGD